MITKKIRSDFYDKSNLSQTDARLAYLKKNPPLSHEEHMEFINMEKERKKFEKTDYKSNRGFVNNLSLDSFDNDKKFNQNYYFQQQQQQLLQQQHQQHQQNPLKDEREYRTHQEIVNEKKKYHHELTQQLEEAFRQKELDKLKDKAAWIQHGDTWNDWVF
jgi:hypothetical protein